MLDQDSFKQVLNAAEQNITTPTIQIGDTLDSDAVNSTCAEIAQTLDALYAKTRYLEDIRDYVKAYVEQQVEEKRQKISDRLKVIQHAVDDYENTEFITYDVPFNGATEAIYDRDGTLLHPMENVNGHLEVSSETLYNGTVAKVDADGLQVEAELRNENFGNLAEDKPARCVYYTYKPVNGGIDKEVTLTLRTPEKINFLAVKTANCDVKKLQVILKNGNKLPVAKDSNYLSETEIQGVVITLHAENYDYTKRHFNSQRSSEDKVWKTQLSSNS